MSGPQDPRWQFWIDRGGTFTDIVARRPDGGLQTAKLLSENPEQYRDAALAGMRRLLGLAADAPIHPAQVACVKMGTTVATNALLERKGEPTLLVITQGFRDALRIAYQNRPRLFERHIQLPELLYAEVVEAQERIDAQGQVLLDLDERQLEVDLRRARAAGLRACAIVFMHGYRYTGHEARAAALARRLGFSQVSVSHQVSPLVKLIGRGDTTVVDAYLSPILARYVAQVAAEMPGVPLYFMQSSGGLTRAEHFQGRDAILSGPAGGIVGMVRTAEAAGHGRLIGFDMGGTSTDVSHYAGTYERAFETQVAGVRVRAPMMSIHTVAAGGGSIIRFDGARLRVGPESAGANPGPACYRRGGPLTVTDANVMLGRLQPDWFPPVFGSSGDQVLDGDMVRQRFAALADEVSRRLGKTLKPEALAEGALQIAVAGMANAVKKISVARGYDVSRYTLQCFGGAGGQHACQVADALGMSRVFIDPLAGVLSAYGMGLADQGCLHEAAIEQALDEAGLALAQSLRQRLEVQASQALREQGLSDAPRLQARLRLRYQGSDSSLELGFDAGSDLLLLRQAFEQAYRQRYAFVMADKPLLLESVAVEALAPGAGLAEAAAVGAATTQRPYLASAATTVALYAAGGWAEAGLYRREQLRPGASLDGPAIIVEANATTVVEPGWQARVGERLQLELQRVQPRPKASAVGTEADPVMLEVFNKLFMNIAEQMGLRLQNTAHSVNIKERLDFSCALFDAQGQLIANAPHMPVHLGSMSESIRAVIAAHPQMAPGDIFMLNNPYQGGTHLPDVTVVSPVWDQPGEAGKTVLFYVASRGHHADIGGISPGSMPPFSRRIEEEGVLLDNVKLLAGGRLCEDELLALLRSGPYPARNPAQNLADLQAQIAANAKGEQELRAMLEQYGLATVQAYMRHVQDNAEESVRRAIAQLDPALEQGGGFCLPLDNGAEIRVRVTLDRQRRSACIDFSGSSAQREDNFNAPRAVTMAAVLYVFRTLVDDDIPLNAGCLKPLELIVPEGSMLAPHAPAAVVAGNVEVSSCVTNALYGALGVLASSQCTMNNFTFGNEHHQYYETIAGGSGAGPGFDGTAMVQTHMTNSRLTDPEVLEQRFPVRLESFALRPGSGGAGCWQGGDGGVRRLRFLEPMQAAILSNGRCRGAFGLAGGEAGQPGVNRVERRDGRVERLGHCAELAMEAGDLFVIETPGGGGWGRKEERG